MKQGVLVLYVVAFAISNAWSGIQFKFAAQSTGRTALLHFIIGNLIAACGPVALTFALKRGHPNVVYALCFGTAFVVLQLAAWRVFQQPLSLTQWAGVGCVGAGIFLLQVR
jgi:multidrug transporter EmrE-like cation transporter